MHLRKNYFTKNGKRLILNTEQLSFQNDHHAVMNTSQEIILVAEALSTV